MVVRGKTLIQKTLFLSASHFAVRSVGFLLRLWLSRELGAQTMGLVELAQSAQMLLITPVVKARAGFASCAVHCCLRCPSAC